MNFEREKFSDHFLLFGKYYLGLFSNENIHIER